LRAGTEYQVVADEEILKLKILNKLPQQTTNRSPVITDVTSSAEDADQTSSEETVYVITRSQRNNPRRAEAESGHPASASPEPADGEGSWRIRTRTQFCDRYCVISEVN
jgi:hypothetical protein